MTGDREWARQWELFHAAAELPAGRRQAFVARECQGDAALAERVLELLAAHERAEGFLEPEAAAAGNLGLVEEPAPERLGRYAVRNKIGEGGFADVYLAEQTEPVHRRVAVKVLKPGMDSRSIVARFEAERETLARLEHPGIATVLDAGLADNGRPFVVMELIAGPPITTYCDEHRLDPRARLDLFLQVCHAVQHAHQKGVIHRDLKPSNILVTEVDGAPQVKVIDFGIAKAIDAGTDGRTLFTEAGQLVGTPEYMSPEQAAGADLDTRTDVYALGVLLYELLVGLRPFDAGRLQRRSPSEILVLLREHEAARPSDRLATCERGTATAIAAARQTSDAATLLRRVRGDLDWIAMKALEKERTRRYASPSELAADLVRHLSDEPVLAGPPSAGYRLRKFGRRHKAGVAVGAAVLVLAIVAVVHLAMTARTEFRLRQAADVAKGEATENARVATAVTNFFAHEVLAGADPRRARNPDVPMREVVDAASKLVGERFAGEPLVEATIRQTLGDTYRSLVLYDRALPHLERAAALFTEHAGARDPRTLRALNDLAVLLQRLNRIDDAERIARRILDAWRAAEGLEHREALVCAVNLAVIHANAGRLADAAAELEEVLAVQRRVLGPDHEDTMLATFHLGSVNRKLGKHAQAEPLLRATLTHQEATRGADHPYAGAARNELAIVLTALGRQEEVGPLVEQLVAATARRVGETHVDTAIARANLADHYLKVKRFEDAERLMRESAARIQEALGDDNPTTLAIRGSLGTVYDTMGRHAEAEPHYAFAADGGRRLFKEGEPLRARYILNHGRCLGRMGRGVEGEPLLIEALALTKGVFGPMHANTREVLNELVVLYQAIGRTEQATSRYHEMKAIPRPEQKR